METTPPGEAGNLQTITPAGRTVHRRTRPGPRRPRTVIGSGPATCRSPAAPVRTGDPRCPAAWRWCENLPPPAGPPPARGQVKQMRSALEGRSVRAMTDHTVMTRQLGRTGLQVSAVGLGCWPIGGVQIRDGQHVGYTGVDDAESLRAIATAVDLGITLFDTA